MSDKSTAHLMLNDAEPKKLGYTWVLPNPINITVYVQGVPSVRWLGWVHEQMGHSVHNKDSSDLHRNHPVEKSFPHAKGHEGEVGEAQSHPRPNEARDSPSDPDHEEDVASDGDHADAGHQREDGVEVAFAPPDEAVVLSIFRWTDIWNVEKVLKTFLVQILFKILV